MHPKGISHPLGPQVCHPQGVKAVNPRVVLEHNQFRDITTSEPGALNLELLSLATIYCYLAERFEKNKNKIG